MFERDGLLIRLDQVTAIYRKTHKGNGAPLQDLLGQPLYIGDQVYTVRTKHGQDTLVCESIGKELYRAVRKYWRKHGR